MAKPLSQKTLLIRQVLSEHPAWGNKEVSEWINGSGKLEGEVKPSDVAAVKQSLKKAGESGVHRVPAQEQPTPPAAPAPAQPVTPRAKAGGTALTLDRLLVLKAAIDQAGGLHKVASALDTVAPLVETAGGLDELKQAVEGLRALLGSEGA